MTNQSEEIKKKIDTTLASNPISAMTKFMLSYISGIMGLAGQNLAGDPGNIAGSIAGGIVAASNGSWSDHQQNERDRLFRNWMQLQEDEIKEIGITLVEVMQRIDIFDEKIRQRIESPEYLKLIKKCFRNWAAAESEEKRKLIRNLLANAASTQLCSDDVITLFIKWIDIYSEAHFRVIREIFNKSGITRRNIWMGIHGELVRENSAEADLFNLLIYDLSVGHIIRQHREVDYYGNFIPKTPKKSVKGAGRQYKSAFDDEEEYELTELGKQFVHYTMNEIVPKLT